MTSENTQNQTMMSGGDCRQRPPAADETGMTRSRDGGGSWIYGEPQLPYGGQPAPQGLPDGAGSEAGIPDTVMPGGAEPVPGMNGGDQRSPMSSAAACSKRMRNPVPMAGTHMPDSGEEAYQASLRSLLDRNVGYFVVATFLIGTGQSVTWQGILHTVGSDYIVLYQPDYERYISCDLYSLKFAQFHNVKGIPYSAASQNWQGQIRY